MPKKKKPSCEANAQYVPRQYRDKILYSWQRKVVESRDEFNERFVDCIIDTEGNNGKSTLASIVDLQGLGIDMPTVDEGNKLIQSLCNLLVSKQTKTPGLLFFDMPRAQNKHQLIGLFTAIEQIKKGKVWDFRHRYTEWWFDSPRIWVFTNKQPDTSLLSADRWQFWTIKNKNLVRLTKLSSK
tara:strand:+ start:205 stop:753 length:549 start_codon:yes stop_codon:yes gene_type:complete